MKLKTILIIAGITAGVYILATALRGNKPAPHLDADGEDKNEIDKALAKLANGDIYVAKTPETTIKTHGG